MVPATMAYCSLTGSKLYEMYTNNNVGTVTAWDLVNRPKDNSINRKVASTTYETELKYTSFNPDRDTMHIMTKDNKINNDVYFLK